ncbi:MarR family winged helix-turn-helix transcriptional regulator [Streptomyces hoynatensis]|uniref:MarR family transcriptional regulator n=1 Tax=Streptomyces hoynatensis TaxID=1141874 RepID=A0A3A9Z5T5_9ACTN|nr:MarR family winged helix-turn-helix transcriptional regulator [Streptomyces hoynatensis]RKN43862.1 MarR family transcriptional regulator [Streptomyces hoynatensis]
MAFSPHAPDAPGTPGPADGAPDAQQPPAPAELAGPGGFSGLGTRLRHLLDLLESEVASLYPALGLDGYRPRFSPFLRALDALGPSPVRDLARAVSVTHSAASQTVSRLVAHGLVEQRVGADARQRVVHLTDRARELLPVLAAEWAVVEAAAEEFEAELPYRLTDLIAAAEEALARRPLRARVVDAVDSVPEALRPHLKALRPGPPAPVTEGKDETGAAPSPMGTMTFDDPNR